MKRTLSILIVLAMVFALCACGSTQTQATGTAQVDGNSTGQSITEYGTQLQTTNEKATITEKPEGIQRGTVFTFATDSEIPIYCPWSDNRASWLYYQIYDNLLQRHQGNPLDLHPALAESYTVSDDGLEYVFKIREGVTFQDGEPVNAEAFIHTIETVTRERHARYYTKVESIEATGEYELTFKLSSPDANFLVTTCAEPHLGPVSPKALDAYGPDDNRSAVGIGPFYVESYEPGVGYVLKATENYYNELKQPSIETLQIKFLPEESTQIVAFENGEIDCMSFTSVNVYNQLTEDGFPVAAVKMTAQPMWLNAERVAAFKNAKVREAIAHMIDWDKVNELAFDGMAIIPDSYIDGPGYYPYDEGAYAYDPELGKKLIEEAGYKLEDIKFNIMGDFAMETHVVVITQMLNDNGLVNVGTEIIDGATCYGMLKGGQYDAFMLSNGYGVTDCMGCYKMGIVDNPSGAPQPVIWLSKFDDSEEALKEVLDWYQKAMDSATNDEYVDACAQITRICQENYVAAGAFDETRFWAFQNKWSGVYPTAGLSYLDFCYVYCNEA